MLPDHPVTGFDYTAAVQQQAGIGRYVRELAAALAELPGERTIRLFAAGARPADLPVPPRGCTFHPSHLSERVHNRLWQRLRLPLPVEAWTGPLDLFHGTDFTLPAVRRGTRTVLTIHDLAYERFPDETMPGMQRYLARAVPHSVARADHVIAVSEATRQDLIHLYGTCPEKISVIPHGVDPRFFAAPAADEAARLRVEYHIPPGPVVLTVGTLQPRKNHLRLVQAFARTGVDAVLVVAGGQGWGYDAVLREVERLGLGGRVIFTGHIPDTDLPGLYRLAAVLAYPSLYEGFGLPPLEAMASGTPVVAANTSSLPEVVGEAGMLVDPFDVDALAAALARVLGDATLCAALSERGVERAGRFTWARAAQAVWHVYEQLLAISD
ncbi:MAG: glycosyltransferase family 4 protein [Anaerolineae bacterium]|nr:glycosyltransferase family 4 protein [Anaerolineae bacterium]